MAGLTCMAWCPLISAERPPIALCHTITTSPRGPMSAPCISPMRETIEEATTASSLRRGCLRTGPGPTTFTSTSPTGSPPPSARTARILWLDPESHQTHQTPGVRNMCVDGPQHANSPSGRCEHMKRQSARTSSLWPLADDLSRLAEWDHCVIAAQCWKV